MDHFSASSSSKGVTPDRTSTPSTERRMDFYSDFDSQSHRTVELDQSSTALQALQKLFSDEEIRSGHCGYWAIFEHRRWAAMYRIVEDHETLTHITDSWLHEDEGQQNRFVLKKDYCKYEVYRNPKQFFPEDMLNLSSEKFRSLAGEHPSAQNSFLRNLILSTNWHPEVEGSLYFRDKALFHSPTWKKLYFILRPSGLYSSKHESKDPKHMSLICSLEHLNVYQHQNGKKLGAPTEYVICLSGLLDDKQHNTFLSCESEEMCRNWIVALRLQKFGKQLKDNYQSAAQADLMLNTTDNIKDLALQEKLKARVAMDFSGDCGRLVEDQKGAIEALVTEVQGWKKRRTGRGHSSSDSTSPSLPLHLAQPWFHAALSRDEATRLLAERGLVDGVFLIRKSRSQPRTSVLSVAHSGKVRHYHITRVTIEDNQVCLTLDGGKTKFADLMQLVDFYHLNTGSLCCKLTYPAKISDSPNR